MNLIFFSKSRGRAHHLNLSHPVTLTLLCILGLGVLAGAFMGGLKLGVRGATLGADYVAEAARCRSRTPGAPYISLSGAQIGRSLLVMGGLLGHSFPHDSGVPL